MSNILMDTRFTLEQATYSDTAARLGISNTPDRNILYNIEYTAQRLQALENKLGCELTINSWYRGPELNASIPGSSKTSAHMKGFAIDCKSNKYKPYDLALIVKDIFKTNKMTYDQIIHEYGSWVHISFDPKSRGQALTIFAPSKGYKFGILTKEQYFAQ